VNTHPNRLENVENTTVQNFVLDPGDRSLRRFRDVLRIAQVFLVDDGQACQGLLSNLELLVEGALLHEVEEVLVLGHLASMLQNHIFLCH